MYIAKSEIHCRKYRWKVGDCGMIHCARCGNNAYRMLANRIIRASLKHTKLLFVTIHYSRKRASLAELPLFDFAGGEEQKFRVIISKVLTAIRNKMRRLGQKVEYVAVLAFGKANHRIHKRIHCHILITELPDTNSKASKAHPHRLECPFLDQILKRIDLQAWVERPLSRVAVARYAAANLKTVIGKEEMRGIRAIRFSQGFEK